MTKEVLRSKQRALLTELVERKIRLRAEQLYEERGEEDGFALEDWVQAESEVVGRSSLAPLYWRSRTQNLLSRDEPKSGDDLNQ